MGECMTLHIPYETKIVRCYVRTTFSALTNLIATNLPNYSYIGPGNRVIRIKIPPYFTYIDSQSEVELWMEISTDQTRYSS
jgi:hypothetical protein